MTRLAVSVLVAMLNAAWAVFVVWNLWRSRRVSDPWEKMDYYGRVIFSNVTVAAFNVTIAMLVT